MIVQNNLRELVRTHVILTPARVEQVPNHSKWLTSGTEGTAGRSGRSGDEFQIIQKASRIITFFFDFGQALDKYTPIVTGIGQIYAHSQWLQETKNAYFQTAINRRHWH